MTLEPVYDLAIHGYSLPEIKAEPLPRWREKRKQAYTWHCLDCFASWSGKGRHELAKKHAQHSCQRVVNGEIGNGGF